MKLIAWIIQEIFRMLNQFAVEIPTLPVDQCPPHPIPEGMISRSIGMLSRREGPPSICDTHGTLGNFFCKSRCVFFSTLSAGIESMEFRKRRAASLIYSWKRVRGKHKIKIRDASLDSQLIILSFSVEETPERIMGRTKNDCRFQIFMLTNSLHQPRLLAGR